MFTLRILLHGVEKNVLELTEGQVYTFGRAPTSTYVLEGHPGVSRDHFSVSFVDGTWRVQVLSKFGTILHGGEPKSELDLANGIFFRVPPYDFECRVVAPQDVAFHPEGTDGNSQSTNHTDEDVDEDDFEKTYVGSLPSTAHLRIVTQNPTTAGHPSVSNEENVRLDGETWLAGREETCEILIPNAKISRRQFEIHQQNNIYYITDLGSANGTLLNGQKLPANEPVRLRSGDLIAVLDVAIHFELRDPNFKNKLVSLPVVPMEDMPEPVSPNMFSYPTTGGGAIRIDKKTKGPSDNHKMRIFIAILVVGGALAYVLLDTPPEKPVAAPTNTSSSKDELFERLPPAQKQNVVDTYQLAKALYMQTKYEMASAQLKKLHEILPDGYKDSKKISEDCDAAYRNQEQVEYLKREQEKIAKVQQQVANILFRCEKVANVTKSVDEISNCLSEVTALDPENSQRAALILRVQQRADLARMKEIEQADSRARVQRLRAIYDEAVKKEKNNNIEETVEAYERVIKSPLPDPGNLKEKSRQAIANIHRGQTNKIESSVAMAEQEYQKKNYKAAFRHLEVALAIDPQNEKAGLLNDKVIKELNAILQALYSDSVLEEGLGKLDSAKEKWRKILDIDRPEGEYAKRARNKLKAYGNQ